MDGIEREGHLTVLAFAQHTRHQQTPDVAVNRLHIAANKTGKTP